MAVTGFDHDFDTALAKGGNAELGKTREDIGNISKLQRLGIQHFMLTNNVCYDDKTVIIGPGAAEKGKYPEGALAVWGQIASAMASRFYADRAGKSYPKGTGGNIFGPNCGNPILGFLPNQTPVLIKPVSWVQDTEKAIIAWFKFNYDYACTGYNKKTNNTKSGITANGSTDPPNKKQVKDIEKLFNGFYKKTQFGAAGISLPAIVLDKLKTPPFPDYMPFCKPHKDAIGNTEVYNATAGKYERTGALGYVVGPFLSNKQFLEVPGGEAEQKKAKILDNGNEEEVGVFKEDVANIDNNKFLIDDEFYQPAIKQALGASYSKFRTNVKNVTGDIAPSGIVIDGGQIMLPGPPPKPLIIKDPETGRERALYNLDRQGNGLTKRASAGGLDNPQFGKPIKDAAYGAAEMDGNLKVKHWKNNGGNKIVFGVNKNKGRVWGGPDTPGVFGPSGGNEAVKSFMKFIKNDIGPADDKRAANDPRTWGPYIEYTGDGIDDSIKDLNAINAGLNKLQYKYLIPTGLLTAINTPNLPGNIPHQEGGGLPGFDGNTLPAINKMYWGLRIVEAFPQAKDKNDAIEEALKPPKTDSAGQAVAVPGAGGVLQKGGSTFIGGPAPPFIVQEKGKNKYNFKFDNATILHQNGKVSARAGSPFKRTSAPGKTPTNKFKNNLKTVVKKIDDLVKGEARGGMTWFDASKQIIPPYAPPPLKPPLPNAGKPIKF